ncbi:uncharacterized protein G2W53_014309 [Senna tora]|uniref:Uncharacterized protein n=1 Tax=Senna tora TaxID=362788 RepID=A0A835C677_9FABA|nr:uncharacterized protein G2W53_014309 [Senna tora]
MISENSSKELSDEEADILERSNKKIKIVEDVNEKMDVTMNTEGEGKSPDLPGITDADMGGSKEVTGPLDPRNNIQKRMESHIGTLCLGLGRVMKARLLKARNTGKMQGLNLLGKGIMLENGLIGPLPMLIGALSSQKLS